MASSFIIESEPLDIDAAAATVWSALVDVSAYGEWNPLCFRVEGEVVMGAPIRLWINDPRNVDGSATALDYVVVDLEPPIRLAWEKDFPEIAFKARREQHLEPLSPVRCRYRSIDYYVGPRAEAMMSENAAWVRKSFNLMAAALKARVEGPGGSHRLDRL